MKKSTLHWNTLNSESQLLELIELSKKRDIAIFKHSTRCGISHEVKEQLEQEWSLGAEQMDFYYLDLLAYRSVSNEITALLGVHHQSPQLIILRGGKAIYYSSHHGISAAAVEKAVGG